jgi:hypothetical protein
MELKFRYYTDNAAGQLLHDEFGASRDAFNFYHSSPRMHVEQAFGMLVQRFGILWRKLKFSLPVSTLILQSVSSTQFLH